ncbi:MAG: LysR family transcriptional regulator [Oscillospiraceae bacterium]
MTLRDMEIFSKVARRQKMSLAAEELYISPSSVSQVITRIEQEYGTRLFERLSRTLYLTREGEELLAYVQTILAASRQLEMAMKSSRSRRVLRIGASLTVGTSVLSPFLSGMRERIEGLLPEVLVANTHILEEQLLCNGLDIALVEGKIQNESLIVIPAIDDRLVVACGRSHVFFGRDSVNPEELTGQPLILREQGSGTRAQLETELLSRGVSYYVAWTSYSPEAIKNAVIDGHGITVISQRLLEKEAAEGILWTCPINGLKLERTFDLVYHKDKKLTDDLKTFISYCKSFLRYSFR